MTGPAGPVTRLAGPLAFVFAALLALPSLDGAASRKTT